MNNMKYKLRKDLTIQIEGTTLYRIEGLSDGKLGGYIEKESNLSQEGSCWVYGNAKVYGNAWVSGNAVVSGHAMISGDAQVYGNSYVFGNAQVYGDAKVYGDAYVFGNAWVFGNARVFGNAKVSGNAEVFGNAYVSGNALVNGDANIQSAKDILNIIFSHSFSVTVTPDNIVIGCKIKKRSQWLKVTEKQAEKMGLEKELYPHYRKMIKAAMKLVPKRKK